MPFHKSWKQRRRHSSFCSSFTEIPVAVTGGGGAGGGGVRSANTATTSISASGAVAVAESSISHRNSVTNVDGLTIVGGASRRCSEQQQHFVVMDIINEDKVEV